MAKTNSKKNNIDDAFPIYRRNTKQVSLTTSTRGKIARQKISYTLMHI